MGTKIIADNVGRGTSDTLTTNGSLVVGDNTADRLTVNARINSNLTPSNNTTYSLGVDGLAWNNAYLNNLYLGGSAGSDGQILYNSTGGLIEATSNIYTDGTHLGIGNSSPTHRVDIVGESVNNARIRVQQNVNDVDGPDLKFERARGTTASPANLTSNDQIGKFEVFSYSTGTSNYTTSGSLGWFCPNTDGNGDSYFRLQVKAKDGTGTSVIRTKMETDAATGDIIFTGDLIPSLDSTYDLGNIVQPKAWANIYADNAQFDTITAPGAGLSFSGDLDFSSANVATFDVSDLTILDGVVEKTSAISGASGNTTMDCDNGHIFYLSSIAGTTITPLFTNINNIGTAGYATATTVVFAQGVTPADPGSTVSINGTSVTVQWQGGSAPTGTANKTDVVSYSIMNNGGTLLVMGQLISFG